MASRRIAGITIEIGGDTTKLQTSLKGVDSQLKQTQSALKDVNKLLKMDPGNVELLTQKQKNLESSIRTTKDRLQQLKDAQKDVSEGTAEWDALQREIIATEQDLKGLEKEYKEFGSVSAQQVKVAGEKMQEVGSKVEGVGQALAPVSKAAAAVGAGLLGAGYKAVTTADDLNTLSKQTGLTTDELQKMQYASDLIDVSFESMTGAVTKMKKSMTGHEKTWKALGVSVKDADGHMRNASDVFYETIDALSKVKNETERDQLAMDLFGKSADELAGVVDDGGAALQQYGDKAEELGLILDQDLLNSLNATNDQIDTMKAQMSASLIKLGSTVATVLAPAIEKVASGVEKLAEWFSKLSPEQTEVIMKVVGLVAVISPLLIVGGKLLIGIGQLMTFAPLVTGAIAGVSATLLPLVAGIAAVIAIGVLLYKNWDKIRETDEKVCRKVSDGWNKLKQTVIKNATDMRNGATKAWNTIRTTVTSAITNTQTAVTTKLNDIKTGFSNSMTNIKEKVCDGLEGVKSYFSEKLMSAKDTVSSVMGDAKDKFTERIDSMKSAASEKLSSVKESFSDAFSDIKSSVKDKIGDAYHSFKDRLDSMKDKAKSIVKKLKDIFDFNWKLPRIKLPHISVDGGKPPYGIGGKGRLPSFDIEWYKKAYNKPYLFTRPTILSTPGGEKGFGDGGSGGELVYGRNQLMRDIAKATSGDITINVYASPGMNVNQLADAVQDRLVQIQKQREAAYA